MVKQSTVNETKLGAQEWQDTLFLPYGLYPPELPTFPICHALDCKRGGLVMERHTEICDRVTDLARKSFTPSHMHNDPIIFAGCAVKILKAKSTRYKYITVTIATPLIEAM